MNNDFEDMLDEIRIKINEDIKGLDHKQAAETLNLKAQEIAKKYGITIVKEVTHKQPS